MTSVWESAGVVASLPLDAVQHFKVHVHYNMPLCPVASFVPSGWYQLYSSPDFKLPREVPALLLNGAGTLLFRLYQQALECFQQPYSICPCQDQCC